MTRILRFAAAVAGAPVLSTVFMVFRTEGWCVVDLPGRFLPWSAAPIGWKVNASPRLA